MTRGLKVQGSPCKKCGNTLRYASSRACVHCLNIKHPGRELDRERSQQARKKAEAARAIKFVGAACLKCGGRTRYVSSNTCINCHNARQKQKNIERKAKGLGPIYFGSLCKKHGDAGRYYHSGHCVVCERLKKQHKPGMFAYRVRNWITYENMTADFGLLVKCFGAVDYSVAYRRMVNGWPIHAALTTPKQPRGGFRR